MSRGMRDMGHCIRNSGIKAPGKALLANFRNRLCEASMRAQDLNRHFAPKISVRDRISPQSRYPGITGGRIESNQDTRS
jgi:hypothetical protein